MPGYLIFVRTWKGFADGFPFAKFDDVDDATIHEQLEVFCCEQLRPKDKDGKRIRGEVWTRIRGRRQAKKAAVARLRRQRTHPPNSPETEALRRLQKAGLLDDEFRTYKELGLSNEDACKVRFLEYLGPEGRMAFAKQIASTRKLEVQWEEDHKPGTYCRLDLSTGKQRKPLRLSPGTYSKLDTSTGEYRILQDPNGPFLGCRIAEAAGWLTEPLKRFGWLSPSPRIYVGRTDSPVRADDLTELFSKWHDERLFGWHPLRFAVVLADPIQAVEQTADELYRDSLLSNGPGDVVVTDPIQYQVAAVLPKVLEKLQAAQSAPLQPTGTGTGASADDAATVGQKTKESAAGQTPDGGTDGPRIPERARKAAAQFDKAAYALGKANPTDREAWECLERTYRAAGKDDELPAFDTWQRYVREYRSATNQQKHKPRRCRADSTRSVQSQDDL